jgi:hypothetical protein
MLCVLNPSMFLRLLTTADVMPLKAASICSPAVGW